MRVQSTSKVCPTEWLTRRQSCFTNSRQLARGPGVGTPSVPPAPQQSANCLQGSQLSSSRAGNRVPATKASHEGLSRWPAKPPSKLHAGEPREWLPCKQTCSTKSEQVLRAPHVGPPDPSSELPAGEPTKWLPCRQAVREAQATPEGPALVRQAASKLTAKGPLEWLPCRQFAL